MLENLELLERHQGVEIKEQNYFLQISGRKESLVHTFSWGNSYGPMVLKVLRKFPSTLVLVHGWLFPELFGFSALQHETGNRTLVLRIASRRWQRFQVADSACQVFLQSEDAMGGVEKRGVENLTNDTPPKKGFWTPPPHTVRSVFPVQQSTTEQTRSSFGGVQKFSGERVLWYVFLPPYVLHPPPLSRPKRTAERQSFGAVYSQDIMSPHVRISLTPALECPR